jgi:hypothetical protein
VCLFFNFIIKKLKNKHTLKVYKLSKAKFSRFDRTRGDKNQIFRTTVQLKNHLMSSVELTCRGDPGSAFLVSTMRHSTYPAQGSYTLSKSLLLENLHNLELDSDGHLHKVASTDLNGKMNENVEK